MSEIKLDADSALAGAIRSAVFGNDIYLVLKDDGGRVLSSHVIDMFSLGICSPEMTVRISPTEGRIERAIESYRCALEADAHMKGIL